jgi:hypothetical protein
VKLPPFWPSNPAAWFRSAEAQFVVKGVTSAADKYYLVLAALGENQVERIHNVLDEEPGEAGYKKIKDALLSTTLRVMSVQLEGRMVKVDVSSGVMRPLVPA